jgi:hypothetical protein
MSVPRANLLNEASLEGPRLYRVGTLTYTLRWLVVVFTWMLLAYNLGNFVRRIALPARVKHWTLTTLRDKLINIGGKMVHHARHLTFQLAEVAVPRRLYRAILERVRRFAAIMPMAAPT